MSEKEKQAAKEVIDSLKQIPPGGAALCSNVRRKGKSLLPCAGAKYIMESVYPA